FINNPSTSARVGWSATAPNGVVTDLFFARDSLVSNVPTLSPEGLYVAFSDDGSVSDMRIDDIDDGVTLSPANPTQTYYINALLNIAWTPMRWVTNVNTGEPLPTPTVPATGNQTACDEPMRLAVRDFVTVTPGLPNNLRNNPSVN